MCAGVSPAGRRFAARHADMNFILAPNLQMARETVADVRRIAHEEFDRAVEIWGNAALFCGDTAGEAREYFEHVIHERGDLTAAANLLDTFTAQSESQLPDPALREQYLRNMMAGYSGFSIVGTALEIADFLAEMSAIGLAGSTLSWPDYDAGLTRFEREVAPLLVERGLRRPPGDARQPAAKESRR